jgi:hypothetical protein
MDLLFRGSLSVGFGLGFFSITFFLFRILGFTNLFMGDLGGLALLAANLLVLRRRSGAPDTGASFPESGEPWPLWLRRTIAGAFAGALLAALYSAIAQMRAHPQGDGWDAFAIWNLRARFLSGPHWRDGFTLLLSWSHPDYPLLLPAAIAHFWIYAGWDAPAVPAIIGLAFTFSTAGILCAALCILRGRVQAMLGTMALLATPSFIQQGTWQYADVPLSFFILATIALLCCYEERAQPDSQGPTGLLALAGVAAGFAAWTKNEGVLFLCAIILARQWTLIRRVAESGITGKPPFMRHTAPWLAAALPLFLLIVYFKHSIAPPGDLFSDATSILHRLEQRGRYWAVIRWYGKEFLRFGEWLAIPGTLTLAGLYWAAGRGREASPSPGRRASVQGLVLTLAGYFLIYLITPYDIYWHLRFSLGRLFLQLWPSVIFLVFLSMPWSSGVSAEDVSK